MSPWFNSVPYFNLWYLALGVKERKEKKGGQRQISKQD